MSYPNTNLMWITQYQNLLEQKEKTVNTGVRICVNCGSVTVYIDSYGVFCKDCSSFFNVEEKNEKKTEEELEKKMKEYVELIGELRLEGVKNS